MIKKLLAGAVALTMLFFAAVPVMSVNAQEMDTQEMEHIHTMDKKELQDNEEVPISGDYAYLVMDDKTVMIYYYLGTDPNMVIPSQINGMPVTAIDYCIIYNEGVVTNITIPATVTYIDECAFCCCGGLTNITVEDGNIAYKVVNGVLFNMAGTQLLRYPAGSTASSYTVPSGVRDICGAAFHEAQNLTSVAIPETVTRVGYASFYKCTSLKNVNLPSGLTNFEEEVFADCTSLESIVIPDGIIGIMWGAFYRCTSLKSVTIPESIVYIDDYAFFENNSLADVYYGSSENRWNIILLEENNEDLTNATIHFNWSLEGFVERMYTIALDRESDEAGKADWVGQLKNGTADAAALAFGFIRSEEFTNRNLDDATYLTVLYRTFFNREPDEGGMANWMAKLSTEASREFVLAQFVNSDECMNLCNSFNIERGYMKDDGSVVNVGISKFVGRLYTKVLGRNPEAGGYNDWISRIINGVITPGGAPANFFGSAEYVAKNKDNTSYVYDLYATFFDRAPANGEDVYWIEQLNAGVSRNDIIPGFANSQEFVNLLATFGL